MARKTNGATIREIRKAIGITQRDLAARVGISAPALSQIESGAVQARDDTVSRIAGELGVPLDAITYPVTLEQVPA